MINIIFMGTPEYAKIILDRLIKDNSCNISLVLTQPDRPVGRKKILTPPPVKVLAENSNLKVLQPYNLKDEKIQEIIKNLKPDMIIVAAYGQLLPREILNIAPCINLHASILPNYRGASPIQQTLLNEDEYTGVTAMLMDEGLDSGDLLAFSFIKREEAPTLLEMMNKLSNLAANLIIDVIKKFDKILPIPQLNANATKCKKIKKEDGIVDFKDAQKLYAKYNAYFGWPGIFLENGLKLYNIELIDINSNNEEGKILEIDQEYIIVACKKGKIKIKELQPKSKAKMRAYSYILGKRLKIGDYLL